MTKSAISQWLGAKRQAAIKLTTLKALAKRTGTELRVLSQMVYGKDVEADERADTQLLDAIEQRVRAAVRDEMAGLGQRTEANSNAQLHAIGEEPANYAATGLPSPWSVLIRLGRVAQGMTEGELGNYVGRATGATVKRWEAGEGEPSFRQRTRLIALFAGLAEAPATAQRRRRTA